MVSTSRAARRGASLVGDAARVALGHFARQREVMEQRTSNDIDDGVAMAAPPSRLPELDVMRGVAILAVLWLHSYFRAWPEITEGERLTLLISHLFAHGAVPVFLFISGFLLARDRSPSFGAFVRGRLKRIAIPGVTWMVLALAYESWRVGALSEALLRRFVFFDIEGQFYFLFVLAVLMAAGYPARQASVVALGRVTAALFALGVITVAWYEHQEIAGDLALFGYRNPALWAFFFFFGLFANRCRGDIVWGWRVVLPAAAGMAGTLAVYLWRGEAGHYPVSYFGVTVFLFSSLGLVVYPALLRGAMRTGIGRVVARPLAWSSPYTFGMFLVHKPYFLGWMSSTILMGTRFEESWSRLMLANFALGAAGALGFVWLVDRIWPWFGSMVMGVDHPRARDDRE